MSSSTAARSPTPTGYAPKAARERLERDHPRTSAGTCSTRHSLLRRHRRIIVKDGRRAPAGRHSGHREPRGVFRFYKLAKRAEWGIAELPWNDRPLIPELRGSAEKRARRSSVAVGDHPAAPSRRAGGRDVDAAALDGAPPRRQVVLLDDGAGRVRHCEAWLKLIGQVGGTAERDPHLAKLARATLDAETIEEKVFMMQVFFERLIIPKFKAIARAARGPCSRISATASRSTTVSTTAAGMAYERICSIGQPRRRSTDSSKPRIYCSPFLSSTSSGDHGNGPGWAPRCAQRMSCGCVTNSRTGSAWPKHSASTSAKSTCRHSRRSLLPVTNTPCQPQLNVP